MGWDGMREAAGMGWEWGGCRGGNGLRNDTRCWDLTANPHIMLVLKSSLQGLEHDA